MGKKKKSNSTRPGNGGTIPTQRDQAQAAKEIEARRLAALEELPDVYTEPLPVDEEGYELLPESVGATDAGAYKFKTPDGKKWRLPNLQYIDIEMALKLDKTPQVKMFEMLFDRYAPGLARRVDKDQLQHIGKRWMEHSQLAGDSSGVSLGESKPSLS